MAFSLSAARVQPPRPPSSKHSPGLDYPCSPRRSPSARSSVSAVRNDPTRRWKVVPPANPAVPEETSCCSHHRARSQERVANQLMNRIRRGWTEKTADGQCVQHVIGLETDAAGTVGEEIIAQLAARMATIRVGATMLPLAVLRTKPTAIAPSAVAEEVWVHSSGSQDTPTTVSVAELFRPRRPPRCDQRAERPILHRRFPLPRVHQPNLPGTRLHQPESRCKPHHSPPRASRVGSKRP